MKQNRQGFLTAISEKQSRKTPLGKQLPVDKNGFFGKLKFHIDSIWKL